MTNSVLQSAARRPGSTGAGASVKDSDAPHPLRANGQPQEELYRESEATPDSVSRRNRPHDILGLQIDFAGSRASFQGNDLKLARSQFELLKVMAGYPGQVLPYEFMAERLWGSLEVEGVAHWTEGNALMRGLDALRVALLKGAVDALRAALKTHCADTHLI